MQFALFFLTISIKRNSIEGDYLCFLENGYVIGNNRDRNMNVRKKEYKGLELYELSASQELNAFQLNFCLHKNVAQIPTYIITDHRLDPQIFKKALIIEQERNDCLREHFVRTLKGTRSYFLPSLPEPEIGFADFSGKTREDMVAYLLEDAKKTIRYLKGQVFRTILFTTWDGRSGLYFNVSHMNMDIAAVFIFYRDLLSVYLALENGTEMPAPLTRFEDSLIRDLERKHDQKRHDADAAFFNSVYPPDNPSFCAGVDGMRMLNKTRKRRRDPNYRFAIYVDLLHDKSLTLRCHMDGDEIRRVDDFAREYHAPLQSLIILGMRSYLSAINERSENVTFAMVNNRRVRVDDLHCGGLRIQAQHLRTIVKEDATFTEALKTVTQEQLAVMRHSDFSIMDSFKIESKNQKHLMTEADVSMVLSCVPLDSTFTIEGMNIEFDGMTTGHFASNLYALIVPSFTDGGMDFFYEYRPFNFTEEEIGRLHEETVRLIRMGMEHPDITIGELMDSVK